MCPRPEEAVCCYRVVHSPRIAVRAEPSVRAEIVCALPRGTVFRAGAAPECGWVRLAKDEAWVHQLEGGFVLLDGAEVGLGRLIERLRDEEVTEDTWPYDLALRRSAALNVPFVLSDKHLRPLCADRLRNRWLSTWHDPSELEPVRWLQPSSPSRAPRVASPRPRLAVALLLRGVSSSCLTSFVRYHVAVGFERVCLFFDAPGDPQEHPAIQAARALAQEAGERPEPAEVQLHLCTAQWWQREQAASRFYLRAQDGGQVYRDMVTLHEQVRDVQARQCLVIDRAIRDAHRDGFDWLLHIDSDEALLVPQHRDARDFFASVDDGAEQVLFRNFEAVPESLEVDDWFREVTLFKVHQNLLQEDPTEKPLVSTRRQARLERWRQQKIAKGSDPEDLKENRTFNTLMFGIRMVRRDVASAFNLNLPPVDTDSECEPDSDPEDSQASRRTGWTKDVPCFFTAYTNGKAAVRLRPGSPPPLPVGVHRCTSDRNAALPSHRCAGRGAPVVLHYANCGAAAWRRKYAILATGHGTEDGSFSTTRKGVNSMRVHLANREVLSRGDEAEADAFYRTFVMGNEFGELPHFACHGLLVRTNAVKDLLARW